MINHDLIKSIQERARILDKHDGERKGYLIFDAFPAKGVLYISLDNPFFVSGHVRMRGKDEGQYPYHYLEMIEHLFGRDDNTIEVCSRYVREDERTATVDIDSSFNPTYNTDGETLAGIPRNMFTRWRCDPPYNEETARTMYHCKLPNTGRLLQAGSRVIKQGSSMFLLLGPQNYQYTPPGIRRVGWVAITIVPNNELRCLHIYIKDSDNIDFNSRDTSYQSQLR